MQHLITYFLALSAISCYAALGALAKKIGYVVPPFSLIAMASIVNFILAGTIAVLYEKKILIEAFSKIEWNWFFAYTITGFVGFSCVLFAIARMPVAHYQILGLIGPIIGGLLAVYILKEPFHMRYLLSIFIVAIGVIIAIRPNLGN